MGLDDSMDVVGSRFLYQCCPALEACLGGLAAAPVALAWPEGTQAGPTGSLPLPTDAASDTSGLPSPLVAASPSRRGLAKKIVPTRVEAPLLPVKVVRCVYGR